METKEQRQATEITRILHSMHNVRKENMQLIRKNKALEDENSKLFRIVKDLEKDVFILIDKETK